MLCRLRCLWRLRRLRPVGAAEATGTAGTASGGQPSFLEERWWSSIFLVEDIERRQTDVGDFLLTKKFSCFCEGGDVFADASLVEAHAPLAIERDMPANPKAGKALLRRLPMEERFGMAQFSHLLGHIELNWRDEIRPS